jgi:hypothetical protein
MYVYLFSNFFYHQGFCQKQITGSKLTIFVLKWKSPPPRSV